jgi:hypothetical protein
MLEKLKAIGEKSLDKVPDALREFNDTVPKLKALGLSVERTDIRIGLPPEVCVRLVGSVAALDQDELGKMAKDAETNKLLTTILQALRTAADFKDHLDKLGFKGVSLDVKLGLLPAVEVGLLS